jgi:hypothetical protein
MARGSDDQTTSTPTSPVFASGQGPSFGDVSGPTAAPNLLGVTGGSPSSLLDPGPAIGQAVGGMTLQPPQPAASGAAPMTLKDRAAIFSAALDSPSRGLQLRQSFAPAPQSAQQPAQDPIAALRARLAALGLGRTY